MLQSAIFADLQVNNFGIPTVRLTPALPMLSWVRGSFSQLSALLHGRYAPVDRAPLSAHLRRDIGFND